MINDFLTEAEETMNMVNRKQRVSIVNTLRDLEDLIPRVDALEDITRNRIVIAPLTPTSSIEDAKRAINQIIDQLNKGIQNG